MALKDKIVNLEDLKAVNDAMQEQVDHKAEIDGYYQDMTVGDAEQLISSQYVEDKVPYLFRPTGGSVDVGNRSDTEAIVGGTVAWNQLTPDTQAENTAAGDIVSVDDASAENAVSVKASIEPVQDLHGYDHPWPGGGGKNKFNPQLLVDNGGTLGNDGYYSGRYAVFYGAISDFSSGYTFEADTQYAISYNAYAESGVNFRLKVYYTDSTSKDMSTTSTTGETKTYVSTAGKTIDHIGTDYSVNGNIYVKDIQIEKSTAVTTFAPYANICPISGFEGLTVTRTGKNLFEPTFYGGIKYNAAVGDTIIFTPYSDVTADNGIYQRNANVWGQMGMVMPVIAGQTYKISAVITADDLALCQYAVDDNKKVVRRLNNSFSPASPHSMSLTYTAQANESWLIIYIANRRAGVITIQNPQIELGSTVTEYVPFSGTSLPISWQTEAGTVYGGELDVTTGVLTVDRASVDLGALTWAVSSNGRMTAPLPGCKQASASNVVPNIKCSQYAPDTPTHVYSKTTDKTVTISNSAYTVWIWDSAYSNADTFKQAMSGVQLVYELATPQTYQLTAQQLQMLLGENNVWNDAGSTTLTYISPNKHHTLTSGRKYLARISGVDSVLTGAGQEIVAACGTDNLFDLTQMWGTSIADYIASTGGAAWFRGYFPDAVYPYNAGELRSVEGLESHDTVEFNLWDEEARAGYYDTVGNWHPNASGTQIGSKNYIDVVGGATYYFHCGKSATGIYRACWYDASKQFISTDVAVNGRTKTAPVNARYLMFSTSNAYGNTYTNDICINLSHNASRNGEYEPYVKHSYPLDSSVVLRGIPKLDSSNSLYFDGDEYKPNGTVTRRYGVVDLGTLNWDKRATTNGNWRFYTPLSGAKKADGGNIKSNMVCRKYLAVSPNDTYTGVTGVSSNSNYDNDLFICDLSFSDAAAFKSAMSGVYLVYELATPTTETAAPYQQHQVVSDWGTEEYAGDSFVPVGHVTHYPANLRDKLQHLPDLASSDGLYLIQQSGSQMSLQSLPATAGKYALRVTVSGGIPSYTWEAVT